MLCVDAGGGAGEHPNFYDRRRDPGMVTVYGLNFTVARAYFRVPKSGHVSLCRISSAWRNILLYSIRIRRRRATVRMGCQRHWDKRHAQMHVIYLTNAIILVVAGYESATPRNTA